MNVDVQESVCSSPDTEFRGQWWEFVLTHGSPWHRDHLRHLFDLWEQWNSKFYDSKLIAPYLLLAEPVEPKVYGDTSSVSGFGGRCQIRIRPSLLAGTHPQIDPEAPRGGRMRFCEDVLLHEMVHQWQQEGPDPDRARGYGGHGPSFRDKANEIGGQLALGRVRTCKARGKDKDLPSCSQWPHNVRPAGYYLGAWPRVRTSPDTMACPHCRGRGQVPTPKTDGC